MALIATNIALNLSGNVLLREVSAQVEPGRVVAVLGPNGAGKSTLLRVLSGELSPDSGAVSLESVPLADWPSRERALALAVLPQHSTLGFGFTVEEVVALGRAPHRSGTIRDREVVAKALADVDLENFAQRLYTQLSGGEKQRVHLARVLAQIAAEDDSRSRYLLLDEPTASFDLAHQEMTVQLVRNLAQSGVGVLVVLHDLNLASRCADEVVLMANGAVDLAGPVAQVLNRDAIKRVFNVEVDVIQHPLDNKPLVIQ